MLQISEAESRVMGVLWEHGPATAEEIHARLAPQESWQESTVKTLLNRLLKKGAISAEAEGRRYRYAARIDQSEWMIEASSHLLDRLFQGRIAPLVAHFSEHGKLTAADLAELRQLVRDLDDDR